ncbi:MAG: prolyl oligopeptidase family serine peptidase [Kofleriaceae bacterium]
MKALVAVMVVGAVTFARADDPFTYPHNHPGPTGDPFRYPHGLPPQTRDYSGLGADSITADELARYAPTPLPPALSREIQTLLDLRGATSSFITKSGDRQYFTWRITGTDQVYRQDGPKSFPVQLTGGEDATRVVGIAPDDSFIVVQRDVGGSENPGVYWQPAAGGELHLIQHAPKVQTTVAYVSDDAKSIYYRANDRAPDSFAFYRYDVATGHKDLVFDTPGLWELADERGDQWLLQKRVGELQTEIYQYDLTTKHLTPLLGQGEFESYEARFGAKPGELIVLTNKLDNFTRLYSVTAGKLAWISETAAGEHDITAFQIDHTRTRIYFTIGDGGYSKTRAIDAKTHAAITLPGLPLANQTTFTTISRDGRFVQFATSSARELARVHTFDWRTRKLIEWRAPSAPEIEPGLFADAVLEEYPARDGTKIPMFVRRPAKCVHATCPVIVEFHGGPEGQAVPQVSASAQLFVQHGFVVVQPNVRGSTGYGKAWNHADDGAKRLDVITDIEDAATFIRAKWGAPKIGILGGSYGGYSALIGMAMFAGAYDAGVDNVGIANLVSFLANTSPYRRALRITEYGDPVKDKVALEKLSPITYVDRIKAPLLVMQGVNDPRVPVGEALQIHDALEARRIDNKLVLFPDEGHGSQKRSNVVLTLGYELAFFERTLK